MKKSGAAHFRINRIITWPLLANSLCPGQEKRTMRKPEFQKGKLPFEFGVMTGSQ
jgi:hypothetical protein